MTFRVVLSIVQLFLLTVLASPANGQFFKLPVDSFQKMVIGDTLSLGKAPSTRTGLVKDKKAMDRLLKSLTTQFWSISNKTPKPDSVKAVVADRISFSYWAHSLFDTARDYSDSVDRYVRLGLEPSRKARNAYLVGENYLNLIPRIDATAEKIRVLKAWTKDYEDWLRFEKIDPDLPYTLPHLYLADHYKQLNADEEAVATANRLLDLAVWEQDKLKVLEWLRLFYNEAKDWDKVLVYSNEIISRFSGPGANREVAFNLTATYSNLVQIYIDKGDLTKAESLIPFIKPELFCPSCGLDQLRTWPNFRKSYTAQIHLLRGETEKAKPIIEELQAENTFLSDKLWLEFYKQTGDTEKALHYLEKQFQSQKKNFENQLLYRKSAGKRALEFARTYETSLLQEQAARDKLLRDQRLTDIERQNYIQQLETASENRLLLARAESAELQQKIDKEKLEAEALIRKKDQDAKISLLNQDITAQKRLRRWLMAGLGLLSLFGVIVFSQSRARQKLNKTLSLQNAEIESQRVQLKENLDSLQNTQAQLLQSEKLASLGELTAGIAHEIQNPLNFVNNFSELSVELARELQEETNKPELDKDLILELTQNLLTNQEKINHHGKRASGIVTGMLQHARTSTGQKELTDVNALADEYLRLAYHGFRAKDSSFKASFETRLDPDLPKVSAIPQDIGRVLLNLIANAFYAVNEKAKQGLAPEYQPMVSVSSKRLDRAIAICINDNGAGIPDSVKAKIFQPFFTTKPSGQGTGLGLSLAYDIVTKGHGGTLEVETIAGEGTSFTIKIPA